MTLSFKNFALAVADLPMMTAFYVGLGFEVAERGRFDAVDADFVMLDGAGIRLELVCRAGTRPVPVDRTPPPAHLDVLGWKALVLQSSDLAADTQKLIASGTEIVWADVQISAGYKSTMIRDPEGNMINIFASETAS